MTTQINRMTRYLLIIVCFSFSFNLVLAQGGQTGTQGDILKTLQEGESGDRLSLDVDSLLMSNYNKLIAKNMKSSGIPGYRIRIYSESGIGAKQEQQQVRARFLSLYPDLDAYNRYDEPFFKIYVGDCRTKSDALNLQDMVRKNFSSPIVVEDFINPKPVD